MKIPPTANKLGHDVLLALSRLESSLAIGLTMKRLARHRWRAGDGQYILLLVMAIGCFILIQSPGFIVKSLVAGLLGLALLLPITSQFFLPALPIFSWLVLFLSCRFVPAEFRPRIWVSLLPTLENVLYGAKISDLLTIHTHPILDLLAWAPYGVVHFGAPFVVAGICFVWGPEGMVQAFGRAFGYMNIVGVLTQLVFPCSPPWYELIYGLIPANYSLPGSPGGLARIDAIFHNQTYTATFTASPLVFGAFPSLHAACATMEALFLSFLFPGYKSFFWLYVFWIWWACMYLTHHYFVDLVGGSCLATTVFFMVRYSSIWPISDMKEQRGQFGEANGGGGSHPYGNGGHGHGGEPTRTRAQSLSVSQGGDPARSRYSMDEIRPGSISQTLLFDGQAHEPLIELPTKQAAAQRSPLGQGQGQAKTFGVSSPERELALDDEISIVVEAHDRP